MSGPSASYRGSSDTDSGRSAAASDNGSYRASLPQSEAEGEPGPAFQQSAETLEAVSDQLSRNLRELAQTYLRLEGVVGGAEASLMFVGLDLQLQRFTDRLAHLLSLSDEDRGRPLADLAGKLNFPDLEACAKEVLTTGIAREQEVQITTDGWYLLKMHPDMSMGDAPVGLTISVTDISHAKRTEPPTTRAQRYAEKIFDTLQEPVILLAANLEVVSANPAFYRIFQLQPHQTQGKPIYELGDGQWDFALLRDLLERVLPNNESFEGFELTHTFPGIGERTLLLNFCRLDEEQLILLTAHDVTLHRQIERLRQRESSLLEEVDVRRRLQEMAAAVLQSGTMDEMFQFTLDAASEISGADFCVLQVVGDDAELELAAQTGLPEDQLREFLDLASDSDIVSFRAFHERHRVMVEDLADSDLEKLYSLARQMGVRAIQSTPLVGRSGKLLGVLSSLYRQPRYFSVRDEYLLDLLALEIADLCEWVKTEKRLRQSETRLRAQSEQLLANDRQKNQFLGLLGHELRNPLTVMRNALQTLVAEEQAHAEEPKISEALALLERQSRHMTHLVNDLLDITRINNGKVVLKRERVSLPRCLEEVIAAHRSTLAVRELHYTVEGPREPIFLDADSARLFQVLDNLLTNSIKFTQPGGHIRLAMTREGAEAIIRIKDTGIGIPPESLDSLFDPFTQVDNNLACHGLGLGLSLVKSLVDLHGGEITAYSEGEDQGSEFVIHWPLHKQQSEPEADAAPPILRAMDATQSLRILVVDDIADIADSFARVLEAGGHEVLVAYDAEQGLRLAKECRPSVAFLDLIMPETDGYQLARQLREHFSPDELTLVVVSGYGQGEHLEKSRRAGVDHHLLKPIEVQQVYSILESLPPRREDA
ncbi:ATP-binding protein [Gilvimarinus sp. F26214L]|uniref:ATP-binding protein n=1 Tax=Gilvimarinus sp. DZF01 TaxID=3461371 RepID=UPI0040453C96